MLVPCSLALVFAQRLKSCGGGMDEAAYWRQTVNKICNLKKSLLAAITDYMPVQYITYLGLGTVLLKRGYFLNFSKRPLFR